MMIDDCVFDEKLKLAYVVGINSEEFMKVVVDWTILRHTWLCKRVIRKNDVGVHINQSD